MFSLVGRPMSGILDLHRQVARKRTEDEDEIPSGTWKANASLLCICFEVFLPIGGECSFNSVVFHIDFL